MREDTLRQGDLKPKYILAMTGDGGVVGRKLGWSERLKWNASSDVLHWKVRNEGIHIALSTSDIQWNV
jgi:hypothetical protein